MIELLLSMKSIKDHTISDLAYELHRFVDRLNAASKPKPEAGDPIHLLLTPEPQYAPFRAFSQELIALSTEKSDDIARYLKISVPQYLELCTTLVLTQSSALVKNSTLIAEDFNHPPDVRCVFNTSSSISEYVLQLEGLSICPACAEFYRCLSCELELERAQTALNTLRKGTKYCEK